MRKLIFILSDKYIYIHIHKKNYEIFFLHISAGGIRSTQANGLL